MRMKGQEGERDRIILEPRGNTCYKEIRQQDQKAS